MSLGHFNDDGVQRYLPYRVAHSRTSKSRVPGDFSTITTGTVRAVSIANEVVTLHCASTKRMGDLGDIIESTDPYEEDLVQVAMVQASTSDGGGLFSVPRVGDKIVWMTAGSHSYYFGSTFDQARHWPFSERTAEPEGLRDGAASPPGTEKTIGVWSSVPKTGMRIPDGLYGEEPGVLRRENSPGRGRIPTTEDSEVLIDTTLNAFLPVSQVAAGDTVATVPRIGPVEFDHEDFVDIAREKAAEGAEEAGGKVPDEVKKKLEEYVKAQIRKGKRPTTAELKEEAKKIAEEEAEKVANAAVDKAKEALTEALLATLKQSSDQFARVMKPLSKLRDGRYENDTDGSSALGFNEISITSRTSERSDKKDEKDRGTTSYTPRTPGGITQYAQDYWDAICTGNSTQSTLGDHTVNVGNDLTLEAGKQITLRVGKSAITLTDGGVTIGNFESGPLGSSIELTASDITSTSLANTINTYTYSVDLPYCSFGLGPMGGGVKALQEFQIETGWDNYALNLPNPTTTMTEIATAVAGHTLIDPLAHLHDDNALIEDAFTSIAHLLATIGINSNTAALAAFSTNTPMAASTFKLEDVMTPVKKMLSSILDEVRGKQGNDGSSSFRMNHASIDLNAGYANPISAGEAHMKLAKAVLGGASSVLEASGDTAGAAKMDGVSKNLDKLPGLAKKHAKRNAVAKRIDDSFKEIGQVPSGKGRIQIRASESITSGAYWSASAAAEAGDSLSLVTALSYSNAYLVGRLMAIKTNAEFMKAIATKKSFAGLSGTAAQSTFTYHNLLLQQGAVNLDANALVEEQKEVVELLTDSLLKGVPDKPLPTSQRKGLSQQPAEASKKPEPEESPEHPEDEEDAKDTDSTAKAESDSNEKDTEPE